MILFETTIRDADEVPVAGAKAYVYDSTGSLVSLTDSLGAPVENPLTADDLGYVSGYVPVPAFYTVKYYWAGRVRLIEEKLPLGADAESLAAYSQAFAPFYTTIAAGVAATAPGDVFSSAESGELVSYLRTGTTPFYEVLLIPAAEDELLARDGHKFENLGALRAFIDKLDALSQSEEGFLTIGAVGDSTGFDGAMTFTDQIAREFIGFVGTSSWSSQLLNNAWPTPTGTEPSGRWPGSGLPAYALAGGASYVLRADGSTPDPVYVPNADQHWLIPNGGSVTWTIGLANSNFRRVMAFLVKEPGAGSATVELLNAATDAVIATDTVGSLANSTIDADHSDFTGLDITLGYKVRVTCTAGTIRALGVVGLKRRCVLPLFWTWGGSYLQQQNRSSKAIFDYINSTLSTAITFVETRGETAAEFAGAGIGGDATSGITNLCTRLNAIPGSKVLIGGRPTVSASNDAAQTANYRAAARANDYAFIDGVALLKDNATLAALNWNKKNGVVDNVHLPLITAGFITSLFIQQLPLGHVRYLYNCRKVANAETISASFKVYPLAYTGETASAVEIIAAAAQNVFNLGKAVNLASVELKNAVSGATATLSMFGTAIRPSAYLDLASGQGYWINNTPLLLGRVSGWTKPTGTLLRSGYTAYTANGAAVAPSAAYVQAEATTVANRLQTVETHLQDVSRTLAALVNDLHQSSNTNVRVLA